METNNKKERGNNMETTTKNTTELDRTVERYRRALWEIIDELGDVEEGKTASFEVDGLEVTQLRNGRIEILDPFSPSLRVVTDDYDFLNFEVGVIINGPVFSDTALVITYENGERVTCATVTAGLEEFLNDPIIKEVYVNFLKEETDHFLEMVRLSKTAGENVNFWKQCIEFDRTFEEVEAALELLQFEEYREELEGLQVLLSLAGGDR